MGDETRNEPEAIANDNNKYFFETVEASLVKMGLKHEVVDGEGESLIVIRTNSKNVPVLELIMAISSDGEVTERICIFKAVKKIDIIIPILNRLNERYKLAKFVLDSDLDVMVYREEFGVKATKEWGEGIVLTAIRLLRIADEGLGEILNVLWGPNEPDTDNIVI